ncbi:MAG: ATP-binding cassette domain-containing protein [Bryobacteraceae bacterium]
MFAEQPPYLIEMRRVSAMRGGKKVLRDLDLRIGSGEHVAILGPNGCGKSTLIQTITRELYPLAGPGSSMTILGQERWNVFELRSILGIVTNELAATCAREITGRDVVLSGFFSSIGIWPHQRITAEMRARAETALARLNASYLADRMLTEMSSGEARRVLIARALVHEPHALLFDEPGTSLDLFAQHELRSAIRRLAQSGVGLILVTHHLADIVPEVERVVLMRDGRLVADGPKHEILTEARLEKLFGLPVTIERRDGYYHCW